MSRDAPDPNEQRKAELRAAMRARRALVPDEDQRRASDHICTQLTDRVLAHDAVAVFASTDNEVDLTPLITTALDAGVEVFFPVVTGPGEMEFRQVDQLDELAPGAYGIPEPVGNRTPKPGRIGLVLVPGVAFDRVGTRLGFGGGFYDRKLAKMRRENPALEIVGVAYDWQVVAEPLPAASWDVPMDTVVTGS